MIWRWSFCFTRCIVLDGLLCWIGSNTTFRLLPHTCVAMFVFSYNCIWWRQTMLSEVTFESREAEKVYFWVVHFSSTHTDLMHSMCIVMDGIFQLILAKDKRTPSRPLFLSFSLCLINMFVFLGRDWYWERSRQPLTLAMRCFVEGCRHAGSLLTMPLIMVKEKMFELFMDSDTIIGA